MKRQIIMAAILAAGTVARADGLAAAEKRGDTIVVDAYRQAATQLQTVMQQVETAADQWFAVWMENALANAPGSPEAVEPDTRLAAAETTLQRLLRGPLSQARRDEIDRVVRRASARGDTAWSAEIKALLAASDPARQQATTLIADPDDPASLTDRAMAARAATFLDYLRHAPQLLAAADLRRDRLEDFLTPKSARMYTAVLNGDKGYNLFSSGPTKAIGTALGRLHRGFTYDARKPLREACEKYPDNVELALLRAYVLLIEEHNSRSQETGYEALQRSFERLETEQLAYHLARVGARQGRMQPQLVFDLIDHVKRRDGSDLLGKLVDLGLTMAIREGDWERATAMAEQVSRRDDLTASPVLMLAVLLHQQAFDRIAAEGSGPDSLKLWRAYRRERTDGDPIGGMAGLDPQGS